MIYHFKSRELLLDATIQALEEERAASLAAAVRSATGPAVLDAIWTALVAEVSSGRFGAWLALRARTPFGNRTPAASAGRPGSSPGLRRPLAAALGAPLDALPSDVTISAALEGAAVAIVAGTPEPDVREAYDRLWLGMLSV